MTRVYVGKKTDVSCNDAILHIPINLSADTWKDLLPENLGVFLVEELKRPCKSYPDGLFPGAHTTDNNPDKQMTLVRNFSNYIEFSKVLDDETIIIDGLRYLTSIHYERRHDGWSSLIPKKKKGKVVGWCSGGEIYYASDDDRVNSIFYDNVYINLVIKRPSFSKLREYLADGACLILQGYEDESFLKNLARILIEL